MKTTRRTFLQRTAVTGAILGMSSSHVATLAAAFRQDVKPAKEKLDLLILGGTGFLGPHVVRHALRRGHTIALFNRGKTNPHLFPELEKLKGNRDPKIDEGLSPLKDRKWDAVIDTSSYFPRLTKASAELLGPNVEHYVMVSSVSVYANFEELGMNEDAPVGTLDDEAVEEITGETYGPLKALCEQAAEAAMPGRVANVRPGLIVGPGDSSGRFTYWPVRVARGGEVLAPSSPGEAVQYIDARDLAAWCIHLIEQRTAGEFNAAGPKDPTTIGALLTTCKEVSKSDATFVWADTEWLTENGVNAWAQMPVWVPADSEMRGMVAVSSARALSAGLEFRPGSEIVRDTLAWYRGLESDEERAKNLRAGMTQEQEAKVLAAWHARGK